MEAACAWRCRRFLPTNPCAACLTQQHGHASSGCSLVQCRLRAVLQLCWVPTVVTLALQTLHLLRIHSSVQAVNMYHVVCE